MFARDIMTTNVITVEPEAKVEDIAKLLIEKRISGMPVVTSSGALVGIVSEGDLVHRVLGDHEAARPWWLGLLGDPSDTARAYLKAHGRTAADVMTRGVVTVSLYTHIADIARIMEERHIKRVPVLKDGRVVGIISRANIVQAFAQRKPKQPPDNVADSRVRERILDEIGGHLWASRTFVDVTVANGAVMCWGFVPSDEARQAILLAAANVAGTNKIEDNLRVMNIPSAYF